MLKIQNLVIKYQNQTVVSDFCLNMKKGEIVSVVGESGSGKTTVIRSILGMLSNSAKITNGSILFQDRELIGMGNKDWSKLRGTKISMIFQDSGDMLNPIRKIGSQFVEYLRAHSSMSHREAWEKSEEMLGKMGLNNSNSVLKSYPFQLSGGMRQRVGIAMAMAFEPDLLLADEPTSALDVTTQSQIVKEMMTLRETFGTGIMIVTHNLGVASYMSDQMIVMQKGRIMESGNSEYVIEHPQSDYTKSLLRAVPRLKE